MGFVEIAVGFIVLSLGITLLVFSIQAFKVPRTFKDDRLIGHKLGMTIDTRSGVLTNTKTPVYYVDKHLTILG